MGFSGDSEDTERGERVTEVARTGDWYWVTFTLDLGGSTCVRLLT